ncbi:MAG: BatD family protein [Thermoguttaceae bacterium]
MLGLLILLGMPGLLHAEGRPRMTVELGQAEIFEGQSVVYRITVENVENPKTPELGNMADFDVAFQGQRSLDSRQITNINGVIQLVIHRGREFHYRLTPKRTGQLMIPSPKLEVDGKTLTGTAERLVVLPPNAQDLAAVELAVDHPVVYPTQPFTVTLSVFVKQLPPPASDRDPLSVQRTPPVLRIPWLTDQDLPGGLSPKEDWQHWVKGFIDREGAGFGINELVRQTAFSLFAENDAVAFRPRPKTVQRRDAQGQAATYYRYDFPRTFTAKQIGPIVFAAVTLQGTFAERANAQEQLVGKEIYAASKPLLIAVKDVPKDGRPDSYSGAIGHFQIAADLTPRQSKVGDPLTFTLTLRGSGSLAGAKAPELSKSAVAARFKVYEATQKSEADAVHFVYSLRPLAEGDEPFPAVPVAYFDVDQGRYETLQSEPIPLRITKAEQLSGDQIVASPRAGSPTGKDLEARREGIFANISDVALARDQSVRPGLWLIGLAGCLGAYPLIVAVTVFVRRRAQDKSALRRRAAAARARGRLREAVAQWRAGQVREAADHVQDALAGLVADLADLHDAGLTPKDVLERFQQWGLPETLIGRVRRLLEACDAARYGGAIPSTVLTDEAEPLLEDVIEALRAQKRFR